MELNNMENTFRKKSFELIELPGINRVTRINERLSFVQNLSEEQFRTDRVNISKLALKLY